jgi:flagellar basal-body rod protein FlgB
VDVLADIANLEKSLDFHLQRHGVLASNLAHADTPGYVPKDLEFSDVLSATQPRATDPRHIGFGQAPGQVVTVEGGGDVSPDRNEVNIENAMAQVSANRLRYETGLELARRRVALTRYAASDGSAQ